jgi:hypothetical protein
MPPQEGKISVVTLFVSRLEGEAKHRSEPNALLANWELGEGEERRFVKVVAHFDPASDIADVIDKAVATSLADAAAAGVGVPEQGYGYFLGRLADGSRYIVGARPNRDPVQIPSL